MTGDRDRVWAGSMPEVYERCLGPVLFRPFAVELAARVAAWAPRRVLELAAGTGILTRELAGDVTATDLNAAMVAWGADAVPGARWERADAQRLPFDTGSFDLVCSQFGVMFLPDRVGAYTEALRVLLPGGRLLFSTWDRAGTNLFAHALTLALPRVFPDDPPTFVADVPHGHAEPDAVTAEVRAAGFTAVELETVTLTGHAPSAASVATGFCTGTPLRAALEERGDLAAATAAVAAAMTAELGEGPVSGPMRAHVVTALRP